MSQYAHLSQIDPEFAAQAAQAPVPPPLTLENLPIMREMTKELAKKASYPESQLKIQDWTVPVKDGNIQVRTYVPPKKEGQGNPLLVWAHGGGWAIGGLHMDDATLQKLAVDVGVSAVNVDYRLSPEYQFPIGLNDTYDALKWAFNNSEKLDADPKRGFLLGGCSAGGNLAAVLAHRARDDPEFPGKITGQVLQIPVIVQKDNIPEKYKNDILSHEQNKDAPILNESNMQFFFDTYGCKDFNDPNVVPILWPSHKDLPPAYFQICGLDPLRDEGFLYEKILKEEGIKTKADVYPGLPHGFDIFFPTLTHAAKFVEDMKGGVAWLLEN